MPKSSNQKLKLLYLKRFFYEMTDAEHMASIQDIMDYLKTVGISVERKTVYSDIHLLREYGMDIKTQGKGRGFYYGVEQRMLSMDELLLIVKALDSYEPIERDEKQVILGKLECLCSKHQRKEMRVQL